MVILETNYGSIHLELDEENTPLTAQNFLNYVKSGFYDGTIFHRVIDSFMIQGGGFEPGMHQKPTGGDIENEADKGGSNVCGSVSMARTQDPHSASAQFFINVQDNIFLDHKAKSVDGWGYCVFGRVVEGMSVVEKIKQVSTSGATGHQDVPVEDVMITKAYIQDSDTSSKADELAASE